MELEYQGGLSPSTNPSVSYGVEDDFPEASSYYQQSYPYLLHAANTDYDKRGTCIQKTIKSRQYENYEHISESDRILLGKIQNLGITAKLNDKGHNDEEFNQVRPIPRFTRRSSIDTNPRNHMDFEYYPELFTRPKSVPKNARRHSEGIIDIAEEHFQHGKAQIGDDKTMAEAYQMDNNRRRNIETRINTNPADEMNFHVPGFETVLPSNKNYNYNYPTLNDDKCRRIPTFNPFVSAAKMMNRSCSTGCLKRMQNRMGLLKHSSTEIFDTSQNEEDNIDDLDKKESEVQKDVQNNIIENPQCVQQTNIQKSEPETDNDTLNKSNEDFRHSEFKFQDFDNGNEISAGNLKPQGVGTRTKQTVRWLKTNKIRQTKREQNYFSPSNF